MKTIKAELELEVPNSVAKRAEKTGIVIFKDGTKYRAKIEQYEVEDRKTRIDLKVTTKNGHKE